MKNPMPKLTNDEWTYLLGLYTRKSPGCAILKQYKLPAAVVAKISMSQRMSDYVKQQGSATTGYVLTEEGERVAALRKFLLDPDTLAEKLTNIQTMLTAILDSGLNERAVITLLHDSTKIAKRDIQKVLDGLRHLSDTFCK